MKNWEISNHAPPELQGEYFRRWYIHHGPLRRLEYARDESGNVLCFASFEEALAARERLLKAGG